MDSFSIIPEALGLTAVTFSKLKNS